MAQDRHGPGGVGRGAGFSSFRATQPQLYVDVDRAKVKSLGVKLDDVFSTLQVYRCTLARRT